jgi:hypothetical protein
MDPIKNRVLSFAFLLVVFVFIMLLAGRTTANVKPCANIATHSTLWQVGVTVGRDDYSCSDGLDDDYLDPDIYTDIGNN